jgi:hypothetical protein
MTLVGSILFNGSCRPQHPAADQQPASSMQLLSSGDLESEVYQSHAQDEIGAMANSLQVFRESMIESRALSAEQDKDRVAKSERIKQRQKHSEVSRRPPPAASQHASEAGR